MQSVMHHNLQIPRVQGGRKFSANVPFWKYVIPATLVVGFTMGGPIFEVFQVLAEDFKIVRFSLVLFVRLLCQ